MTEGGREGPPLTPEEIARLDAEWDAIDAGLAKGDPRFAGYLATRARLRLTPHITRRSGTMTDQHAEDLIAAIKQIGADLYVGIDQLLTTLADISAHLENIASHQDRAQEALTNIDAALDEELPLLPEKLGRVEAEINALRTSDR